MPDRERPPVIFLAFANNRQDGARYLRKLPEERRRLRDALGRAEAKGLCEVVIRPDATVGEVLDVFQDSRYRDRIAVFHFGGHAGSYQLLLQDTEGAPALAHAEGLADFLGQQRGLQLVFLNGCSTQPQTEGLERAGIPAVIATAEAIADEAAMELSARFYTGLASGVSLQAAYDEAVAAVKTQRGGIGRSAQVRDMVREDAAEITGRWPWDLYLRDGAEAVGAWSLPEAAGDPLFGLPSLPERDLPETPYRHLKWFREDDAEVFFGRGHEIRDLYERVTAPASAPILLFYGQSGVGKSSLLAAGLLPRLEATHAVRYARRERERGLVGTLADALETEAGDVSAAWHAGEEAADRPLVVILDQAEELYTRPGDPGEMAAFLDVLAALFADRGRRPRGKLVLAFRKEWLADLEARLSEARLPRAKFYLERLDRDGIVEIVDGPARAKRLRQQYGLTIEDGLAAIIADDLLEDREAPVAPTLEILLTKMWDRATAYYPDTPTFTVDLYQQLKRDGLLLDDFLAEQLDGLRAWNADVVESGLALDVLAYHTTPLGTAERRTQDELEAAYGHQRDVLPDLVQQSKDHYLLTAVPTGPEDEPATRLAHDTLAPLVRERHKASDKPGQRAVRILESRAIDWQDGRDGAPLDRVDLKTVEEGHQGMRGWSEPEQRLVTASRSERDRQERQALRRLSISTAQRLALIAPSQRGRDEHRGDRQWLLLARQAYAFNEDHEGPMFGTIDRVLRDALRLSLTLSTALAGHESQVRSVSFNPDGSRLASASVDNTVRVWSLGDLAAEPVVLRGHKGGVLDGGVSSVSFSPDGARLASAGGDGTVRVWSLGDPAAEPVVLCGHGGGVNSVSFSPDGSRLASAGGDKTVRLWSLGDPAAEPVVLRGHRGTVYSVSFSPDGSRLASGGGDGTVRLWAVGDLAAEPVVLRGHRGTVYSVSFSPDGSRLASAGGDGTVRLWAVGDLAAELAVLTGHRGTVYSVSFSPDGARLASAGDDGTMRVWSLGDPATEPFVLRGQDWVNSVSFSPDGSRLASGGADVTVQLWAVGDPAADSVVLRGHEDWVSSVSFSPDGSRLASAGNDETVRVWVLGDLAAEPVVLRGHEGGVSSVSFSPDGSRLASASGRTVRLWAVGDLAAELAVLTGHEGTVYSVSFSPDGARLASAGVDETVRVWVLGDLAAEPVVLLGYGGTVSSVSFSPDGARLASASGRTVRLWSLGDLAAEPVVLRGHEGTVSSVSFSPDGSRLASAGGDETVRVWSLGDLAADPVVLRGHEDWVKSVSFSPDGARLASAGVDETVRVWSLGDLAADPVVLRGHEDIVSSVSFSPDGARLASAGGRTVRVWKSALSVADAICDRLDRNLTREEWDRFIGEELPYECTCSNLPPHPSTGLDACPD